MKTVLALYHEKISIAVHLGDYTEDIKNMTADYPAYELYTVPGAYEFGPSIETEHVIQTSGKKILLTHGHRHNVKQTLDWLIYHAEEQAVDACLFGHTHEPVLFEKKGILFMNPGSISMPRTDMRAQYGLLHVTEDGQVNGVLMTLPS